MIFHLCSHWTKYIPSSKQPRSTPLNHRYIWPLCYDRTHKQVIEVLII